VIRKVNAQTGIITTVAGNGTFGSSGDGGLATLAQLASPVGIAVDSNASIYIADQVNHRIRVVEWDTGIIGTSAGNGQGGFAGDGGQATAARLLVPQGVAVDHVNGNLYIADTGNFRVRRVQFSTGIITTICGTGFPSSNGDGGPATSASLSSPRRLAIDQSGNLYILDRATNARIRRIDGFTGIITTVAGGGTTVATSGVATDLNLGPLTDLAVDENGALILTASFRVWKVEGGMATVISGTGTGGFSGDGGDPLLAAFNNLSGIAVNADQHVFLSDRSNHRIRKIAPSVKFAPGDVNHDGHVNIDDLTEVILAWGRCRGCAADISPAGGDGVVNIDDLTAVILSWGQ
ncbi:MAG TPA: hypothetical protein VG711_03860, partial [Phycisphaerales bacterium]|nr:hypothetical protein [Phycisphaerales bacterium]